MTAGHSAARAFSPPTLTTPRRFVVVGTTGSGKTWVILPRVVRRTVWRGVSGVRLWSGNRESLYRAFFTRDSIILWTLQTYRRRRREYARLFADPAHGHLHFVRLRSPQAAQAWLKTL
jgi:hypothetical protein